MYIRTLPSSSCWTCRSAFAPGQHRRCLSLVYLSGGNRDPGSPRPDLISGVAEPHAPPSAPTRSANASFILTSPHPHLMPARHSVRHCVFFLWSCKLPGQSPNLLIKCSLRVPPFQRVRACLHFAALEPHRGPPFSRPTEPHPTKHSPSSSPPPPMY